MVELPSGHSKGGGFSSAALGGSAALPSGTDPRTGQRAPTQEPAISKAKSGSARVFCLLPVLACLCRGSPGSGSLVLRPCPFGFLFVFVPPDVSFYWPRASRSSSQREGRRVKRRGTDPRTGPFQVSLYVRRPGVRSFSSSLRCLLYFIIGGFGLFLVVSRSTGFIKRDQHILWCSRAPWRLRPGPCARQASMVDNKTSASEAALFVYATCYFNISDTLLPSFLFSDARVFSGDWDPVASGRRAWMAPSGSH